MHWTPILRWSGILSNRNAEVHGYKLLDAQFPQCCLPSVQQGLGCCVRAVPLPADHTPRLCLGLFILPQPVVVVGSQSEWSGLKQWFCLILCALTCRAPSDAWHWWQSQHKTASAKAEPSSAHSSCTLWWFFSTGRNAWRIQKAASLHKVPFCLNVFFYKVSVKKCILFHSFLYADHCILL